MSSLFQLFKEETKDIVHTPQSGTSRSGTSGSGTSGSGTPVLPYLIEHSLPPLPLILSNLVEHAKTSIANAMKNTSKLTVDILNMEGMSGYKTRHLYNNMCSMPDTRYLEIGTWKGSSFVSAMFGNGSNARGFVNDNWTIESSSKKIFEENTSRFLDSKIYSYKLIDKDCWTVSSKDIDKPINVFMYDGAHTYEDQKRAITYFSRFFDRYAIVMIDDWMCDWVDVKRGTMDGFKEAGLEIIFQHEIGLINTTSFHMGGDTFWNGCGIFVCKRTDPILWG